MNFTRSTYIRNIKSAGLFGGVQIINIIIGLIKTKFVAILLGTNGFGMFSIFNSIVRMSGDITGLGIQTSGVKKISNSYEESRQALAHSINSVRSWSIFAALCGFLITLIMSPLFNFISFGKSENHLLELFFIPLAVSLTTLSGGEIAILKGTGEQSKLAKGIDQLMDEGVAQLFVNQFNGRKIIGTVGQLQFEVIQYRLENEYSAKCRWEPLSLYKACWIESDDLAELEAFKKRKYQYMAKDREGRDVFLADSGYVLQMAQMDFKHIKFHFTSEF
jgi:uncharacterized membrane protein